MRWSVRAVELPDREPDQPVHLPGERLDLTRDLGVGRRRDAEIGGVRLERLGCLLPDRALVDLGDRGERLDVAADDGLAVRDVVDARGAVVADQGSRRRHHGTRTA